MKVILSRKAFDSSAGGVANPILRDGRLVPLPIPDTASPLRYGELTVGGEALGPLVSQLTRNRVTADHGAHLDPDLERDSLKRPRSWRPVYGQAGATAGHLDKMGLAPGDLFLFFGWFRQVDENRVWCKGAPDLHILFGWFQVDEIIDLSQSWPRANHWLRYHPHFFGDRGRRNVLFLARRRLTLPETVIRGRTGAGRFDWYDPELVLTETGQTRGRWLLPPWFHPQGRQSTLSYHHDPQRWSSGPMGTHLDSVRRGQDFVLDCDHYPEAIAWAASLIRQHVPTVARYPALDNP